MNNQSLGNNGNNCVTEIVDEMSFPQNISTAGGDPAECPSPASKTTLQTRPATVGPPVAPHFQRPVQNSVNVSGDRKFRVRYDGGSGNDVTLALENRVAQIQTMNTPATWPEGGALGLTSTYLEAENGGTVKLVLDWGDGALATNDISGGVFNLNHPCAGDDLTSTAQEEYTIPAFPFGSKDGKGLTFGRFPMITNVPPSLNAPTESGVLSGRPIPTTLAISDPGTDTFQAHANYGAGGGAPAVPVVGNLINLNYGYPIDGSYPATLVVLDEGLGETQKGLNAIAGQKLSIADAGSNVKLSWPTAAQDRFVEGKTDVASTNWAKVPIVSTLAGNKYYINVPKPTRSAFTASVEIQTHSSFHLDPSGGWSDPAAS